MVDEVRRRVQQDTLGCPGRKATRYSNARGRLCNHELQAFEKCRPDGAMTLIAMIYCPMDREEPPNWHATAD